MKKLVILLLSILTILTVAACGNNNTSNTTPADSGDESSAEETTGAEEATPPAATQPSGRDEVLVVGATAAPSGRFSPIYFTSTYDGWVVRLVFDSLLAYDENNKLVPILASELPTWSEDYTQATFHLREGVVFSDGSPFTAHDVAFTFNVMADPAYSGRYNTSEFIVGFEDVQNPDNDITELSGINIIDDYTIEFNFIRANELNRGVEDFGILSANSFPDYVFGDETALLAGQAEPIGTGPYVLQNWTLDAGPVLVRNPLYWGDGYEISTIVIRPIEDQTKMEELSARNVDLLPNVLDPHSVDMAYTNPIWKYISYPRAGMGYVTFNAAMGATADMSVRQALMFSFNRQEFVDVYYATEAIDSLESYVPATFQNPASLMGDVVRNEYIVDGLEVYPFDLDRANQILDDAGWEWNGTVRQKDGETLTLRIVAIENHDILDMIVPLWVRDWGAIGADVQVAQVDFNSMLDIVFDPDRLSDWSVFFLATSFTGDIMSSIYNAFHSSQARAGGDNFSHIMDDQLDALLDTAADIFGDDEAAREAWIQVAIRVNELAAQMPIYGNTWFDIFHGRLQNYTVNTLYEWTSGIRHATLMTFDEFEATVQ